VTEAEWLASTDPEPMLELLRGKATGRKLRLFACACCRRIWHLLAHEESRRAVQTAELYAEGLVGEPERLEVNGQVPVICPGDSITDPWNLDAWSTEAAANTVFGDNDYPPIPTYATTCAVAAARAAAAAAACAAAVAAAGSGEDREAIGNRVHEVERREQSSLVCDIFGNPFRSVVLEPAWQAPQVVALAQAIHDVRAYDRLPALADALEQAGCRGKEILAHCRGPGPHVRGCWVVDLLLEKE
jgi:hypothetical protein